MRSYKFAAAISGIIFSIHASSYEIYAPSINPDKVHVKGKVIQAITHENISCLFIQASKLDQHGRVIPWRHQEGGDVMACSAKSLLNKSLKNKYVAIDAEFVSMNFDKKNPNFEPYPIVKVNNIERLDFGHSSLVAVEFPLGYLDPGFHIRSQ